MSVKTGIVKAGIVKAGIVKSRTFLVAGLSLLLCAPILSAATCAPDAVTVTGIDTNPVSGFGASGFGASVCENSRGPLSPAVFESGLENGSLLSGANIDGYDWVVLGTDKGGSGSAAVSADINRRSGKWSADFGADTVGAFVVRLKAGRNYALFLFDDFTPGSAFDGTFSTRDAGLVNQRGKGRRLSQFEVAGVLQVSTVPVPATLPLLAAGMLSLAVLRRRQRKASRKANCRRSPSNRVNSLSAAF